MAISDFLKIFPKPDMPCIYTGQFQTKWKDRPWDESPKKSVHGVSRTQYGDAMQIRLCDNLTLFEMFHKWCDPFAAYICKRNPDWKMVSLRRDTFYNSLIHAFAVKERESGTLYADARGITDDPEEFFLDFNGFCLLLSAEKAHSITSVFRSRYSMAQIRQQINHSLQYDRICPKQRVIL